MALTLTFDQVDAGIPAGSVDRGRTDIKSTGAVAATRAHTVTITVGNIPTGALVDVVLLDEPPNSNPLLTQLAPETWTLEFDIGCWGPFRVRVTATASGQVVSSVTRRISIRSPGYHIDYPGLAERYDPNATLVPTVPSVELTEMNEGSTNRPLVDFHRQMVEAIEGGVGGGGGVIPDGSITEEKLAPALSDNLLRADGTIAFTGDQNAAGHIIHNVGVPLLPGDAVPLSSVIAAVNRAGTRTPCRIVATIPITASNTQVIDSVATVNGDRVLLTAQASPVDNGIYIANDAGPWLRSTDADSSEELLPGMVIFITAGTAFADSGWILSTDAPILLGTSALTFTRFTGSAQLVAGAGLTKTGNAIDVVAHADGSIVVSADAVQVGILATDAQHGSRGGGTQHAAATTTVAGFFAALDKTKLDGVEAGAQVTSFARVQTALAAASSAVAFNAQRLTGVADPTAAQDVATKAYTDAVAQGLDVKASVRLVATANVPALTGAVAIDGVTTSTGDRVLLTAQTAGSANGIYTTATGAWARSTDADSSAEVTAGLFVFVTQGTAYADTGWVLTTNDPITLGTTSLAFAQFSGAGQITAGTGLTKTGNTLDVVAHADGSIAVSADAVQVGILATDAQHGTRGGGTQHAAATTSEAGFFAALDKTKLDGVEAGAQVTSFARVQTALSTASSAVGFNAQRLSGVADPTAAQDVATKAYTDAVAQGLDVKASCRAVATTNLGTLSGNYTIDGITTVNGDRLLLTGQNTASQNGIWVTAAGAWARGADADSSAEVTAGLFVFVTEGTVNADSGWVLTTNDPITLGTTGLVFTQFSGAAQITAGTGLTKTGNTLDVVAHADGSIAVSADAVQVGILATDAQHGSRGGGTQHAAATTTVAGFFAALDKTKLDGVEAGAQVTSFARVQTALAAASSAVALNAQRLSGVADPSSPQDAATKAYVDAVAQGLDTKASVRLVATANVPALTGAVAIDGVTTSTGDRVLLTAQTAGSANGIYTTAAGAWARSTDADSSAEVNSGMYVFVTEGTANADSGWALTTNDPIVLGTTALAFTQVSGAGQVIAGAGLTKTGNQLDVVAHADGSIVVAADSIQLGVIATDAQHGLRAGGTTHAAAIAGGASGFLTGADKARVDGANVITAKWHVPGAGSLTMSGIPVGWQETPVAGDRALIWGHSTPATDGIWVIASGAWTRAPEAATTMTFPEGTFISTHIANTAANAADGDRLTFQLAQAWTPGTATLSLAPLYGLLRSSDSSLNIAGRDITSRAKTRSYFDVRLATATTLPAYTATTISTNRPRLTATANGALSVDGVAVVAGDLVLVLFEAAANCGVYQVIAAGAAGAPYQLDLAYSGAYTGLANGSLMVVRTTDAGTAYCNREFLPGSGSSGLFVEIPGELQVWPRDVTPPTTIYPGWLYELDLLAASPTLTLVSPAGSEQVLRGVRFGINSLSAGKSVTITPTVGSGSHISGPDDTNLNSTSTTFALAPGATVQWVCGRGYTSYNPDSPYWRTLAGSAVPANALGVSATAYVLIGAPAPTAGDVLTASSATGAAFAAPAADPAANGCRLSPTADDSPAADGTYSTIYLAPSKSDRIALYDGTNWRLYQVSSVSYAVTGRTTDLPFDIFAAQTAGVVSLEVVNWTSATARATAIARLNGVWTKSGDSTRRYLGTCRPRSATTYHLQTNATDTTPAKCDLWNIDNQVTASFRYRRSWTPETFTHPTANTWVGANGSASRFEYVQGVPGTWTRAQAFAAVQSKTFAAVTGIGYDTVATPSGTRTRVLVTNTNDAVTAVGQYSLQSPIGVHYLAWVLWAQSTAVVWWGAESTHESGLEVAFQW